MTQDTRSELRGLLIELGEDMDATRRKVSSIRRFVDGSVGTFNRNSVEANRLVQDAVTQERAKIALRLQRKGWSTKDIGELLDRSGHTVRVIIYSLIRRERYHDRELIAKTEEERQEARADYQKEMLTQLRENNWDLEFLEFSIRTIGCLQHTNTTTLPELVAKTELELREIRGFGFKALREVQQHLDELGFRLGMTPEEIKEAFQ